jgi:hypothetical protein
MMTSMIMVTIYPMMNYCLMYIQLTEVKKIIFRVMIIRAYSYISCGLSFNFVFIIQVLVGRKMRFCWRFPILLYPLLKIYAKQNRVNMLSYYIDQNFSKDTESVLNSLVDY